MLRRTRGRAAVLQGAPISTVFPSPSAGAEQYTAVSSPLGSLPGTRYGLEARGITKTFADGSGQNVTAVDNIDPLAPSGQFWVLLGRAAIRRSSGL
jgi:hypothetical protein